MSKAGILRPSDEVKTSFAPILKALGPARQALASVKDVLAVRPGFDRPASGDPVPALVVAVTPGTAPVNAAELSKRLGVPVSVAQATVEEQMAATAHAAPASFGPAGARSAFESLLTGSLEEFGPPKTGKYEPLEPHRLGPVDEPMRVTICVSPEAGWGELETFLGGTQERLTIAMYQFTAPHIFAAVQKAVAPAGRKLTLVLHPVPEKPPSSGVKAHDLREQDQVLQPLTEEKGKDFQFSWATLVSKAQPDGLWATAYHIKVAVRDGKTFWLSSGNWQSSNQPDVHMTGPKPGPLPVGFQKKYNRDYHAVIEHEGLAAAYETYIRRDHDLTAKGSPQASAMPDLFVPEAAAPPVAFGPPAEFFEPLRIDRRVKVQPLLTPDNYVEHVVPLIEGAKSSVWFQNQYITFRDNGDDFPDFKRLVGALKKQIDAGLDVRIICRDMMKQESVDILVAMGFPRDKMRFQPACHNKAIIVDGKVVMFGSQNWSNEGVTTNRDASLIFFDEEIAKYLGRVYDYDWTRLATAKPTATSPRVAQPGEATPAGSVRVPFTTVFED